MAAANLTKSANIDTTAREIDFVTSFQLNWDHLREIMGVTRQIKKVPGTELKSKYATVVLQSGSVSEGETIPYSQATVATKTYGNITVEKFAKAVTIEAINEHGYEDAVNLTDKQFKYELQTNVTNRFYEFLATGTLISAKTTFQSALAEAQGRVRNKWKTMHRGYEEIVGWCNILDAYEYLGAANISVQTAFGLNYIENFLGYSKLFLCSDAEVSRGKVIATPTNNMINYYVSPEDSDFSKAGLAYTTDGDTPIIGYHVQGDYKTATSEAFALMGMTLLAEYLDGICVVDIGTATFTAVESPDVDDIGTYFELDATTGDYFLTTDMAIDAGKTYYTRTVTTNP